MKFGPSALSDGSRIEKIGRIVEEASRRGKVGVVVSALPGVLSALEASARAAEKGGSDYAGTIQTIREKHLEAIRHLFPAREQSRVITPIQIMLNDLEDILHGVQLIRECSARTMDLLLSFGAKLGAILIFHYLQGLGLAVELCEPERLIRTSENHGTSQVDFQASYEGIRRVLAGGQGISVLAGGIAANRYGIITSLGRDGEDYTASLIGAALNAEAVEIWTDVDGVMSADPELVPEAFLIPYLSFQEAMELSYFGAKILHSLTMIPAMETEIPIRICSLMKPQEPGTLITPRSPERESLITGIASIDDVALVNIEGGGMAGVPGIAARIFSALAAASVNIMMISQASSEHSICLVIRREEAERALQALERELVREIESKRIQQLVLMEDLAILAIIGEKMRGTPGISGRLFSSLGRAGVNILAIAQGSSERNISFVIAKRDEQKALQAVHRAFLGGKA